MTVELSINEISYILKMVEDNKLCILSYSMKQMKSFDKFVIPENIHLEIYKAEDSKSKVVSTRIIEMLNNHWRDYNEFCKTKR